VPASPAPERGAPRNPLRLIPVQPVMALLTAIMSTLFVLATGLAFLSA